MESRKPDGDVKPDIRAKHEQLTREVWKLWQSNLTNGMDPTVYSKVSVVSLTQVAAITALDVGMDQEQFLAVCQANFLDALTRAPKWGD